MPGLDKATLAAIERFNEETCTSRPLADMLDDPRFQAIQQEENARLVSGTAKSPYSVTPCPGSARTDNPNCTVTSMLVSKGTRSLLVDQKNNGAFFSIVSGNLATLSSWARIFNFNPGKVDIVPNGQVTHGPCNAPWPHQNRAFDIGALTAKTRSDSQLKLECFSDWTLFPWNAVPKKYPVRYNTCARSLQTEIRVYPDIEFGVGFEFKYQREKGVRFTERKLLLTDADRAAAKQYEAVSAKIEEQEKILSPVRTGKPNQKLQNRARNEIYRSEKERQALLSQPSALGWQESSVQKMKITDSLSFFGFYKFSNIEIELKHVLKNVKEKAESIGPVVEKIESIVTKIQQLSEESSKAAASLANAKLTRAKSGFSITYPVVNVKISGLWEEVEGSHECQYGAALVFAAKPIIGLEFKYDLTYAVMGICGPWGKIAAEIKKGMEQADVSALAIVLSVNGKINLETRLELNSLSTFDNTSVTVQAELALKLEIKVVQFRRKVWKFDVVVDIGGSGESGLVLTGKLSPLKFSLDLEWTGIKATVISNTTVTKSVEGRDEPPKATPYKGVSKEHSDGTKETDTEENEKSFKIKGEKFPNIYNHVFE